MSCTLRLSLPLVFLWSTGFIAFKFCSPYAEPATFTVVRVTLVAFVLFFIIVIRRSLWPERWIIVLHSAIVGILIHGIFAGSTFASIYHGIDVAHCALIFSLQPLVMVLLSCCFLGEKITTRKLLGIAAGTTGVALIVLQGQPGEILPGAHPENISGAENSVEAVALSFLALIALSVASLYQKCFCSRTPLFSGAFIQFTAAAVFMLPIALVFETLKIEWNLYFSLGLGWLVLFISIGAMTLLMLLINTHEAGSVASIFYLITPLVAVQSWIFFNESLSTVSIAGMLLCAAGVAVINHAGLNVAKKQAMVSSRYDQLSRGAKPVQHNTQ